ncbi:MAG TPA: signal peptidase I [Planctomycetota bacterium]|jgi:signal peptidase I|nr:signal peptidase I [Planctomycetota bacterium]
MGPERPPDAAEGDRRLLPESRRKRHPWRENLETLSVAVVLALTLKVYAVEAYKIPTGSMQPTLMGSDEAGIYDRILVDKLVYQLRDPRRWEVVVFRFPLDLLKNYVKRIVGVGPERIRIENGDVFRRGTDRDEWEILRKPRSVQEAIWKEVYRGPQEEEDAFRSWRKESGRWSLEGGRIRADGEGRLRFVPRRGESVRDVYTDGYPASVARLIGRRPRPDRSDVPDLRLSATVRPEPDFAGARFVIQAGVDTYEASFPGPASGGARGFLRRSVAGNGEGKEIALEGVRLEAGREARLSLAHVDGALEAGVAGRTFRFEWPEDPDRDFGRGNRVAIAAEGGRAEFRDLRLERDVYYTKDGGVTSEFIPEGRYFMLGDNTQNSADSRAWESVTLVLREPIDGRTELRGNYRADPNFAEANPRDIPRPGGFVRLFTDYLGEIYRIPTDKVVESPRTPEPYVRREQILGRALVVFWPVPPVAPALRWKLVR